MGLKFDPVGGGQFKQALKAIVEAERQPIKTLENRKAREESKVKLFGDFKSKFTALDKSLQDISSFRKFRELKADLGDGQNHFSVTIDKEKAEPGQFDLEILSTAKRSSVISNGFSDPEKAVLGVGFAVFGLPDGSTKEIWVGGKDASLKGIATAINRDPNSPVRASVIRDASDSETPWRLIFTSKKDGAEQGVDFPELYFLDGERDFYFKDNNDAKNALVKVDNFEIELASNDVPDFLPGVNLHLKQAKEGQTFQLNITEDFQKISGKIKSLVDGVNGILEFINKQNQVDDKTETRPGFAGDTSLQGIEFRLRNLMHEGFPVGDVEGGDFKWVFANELGISFNKNGMLEFKEEKFTKLMESDFENLAQAITGEHGFARQLSTVLQDYTRAGTGMLAQREQSMRNRIQRIDDDIAGKEQRLDRRQQQLTEQFARLQGTLSNLQRQSSYLASAMPSGGGGNLISQLLGG